MNDLNNMNNLNNLKNMNNQKNVNNQNNQNSQQGGRSFGASGGGQKQPPAYSPEEEPF